MKIKYLIIVAFLFLIMFSMMACSENKSPNNADVKKEDSSTSQHVAENNQDEDIKIKNVPDFPEVD